MFLAFKFLCKQKGHGCSQTVEYEYFIPLEVPYNTRSTFTINGMFYYSKFTIYVCFIT